MTRSSLTALAATGLWMLACTGSSDTTPPPADDPPSASPKPTPGKGNTPRKGRKKPVGCEVSAYLLHEHGTVKLHADPDRKSKVVGEIPANHDFVRVHVTDVEDGHLKVSSAEVMIPDQGPVQASGWLDRRLVRVGFEPCADGSGEQRDPTLFSKPSIQSPVAHVLKQDAAVQVTDCSGTFWKIDDTKGHTGWAHESQWCDNAVTNCIQGCPELKDLPR